MANTFKSFAAQNVGTTKTTIYTVPGATTSTVIGLSVANLLPSTVITVDVKITKGGTETFLVKGAPINAGGALVVIGGEQKLVLETTDNIKIQSSNATSADVVVSLLESN